MFVQNESETELTSLAWNWEFVLEVLAHKFAGNTEHKLIKIQ